MNTDSPNHKLYKCIVCANKEQSSSPVDLLSPNNSVIPFYKDSPPLNLNLSSDRDGKNAIVTSFNENFFNDVPLKVFL